MRKISNKSFLFAKKLLGIMCWTLAISANATPLMWTISPLNGSQKQTIPENGTGIVQYIVENKSNTDKNIIVMPKSGITKKIFCQLKPRGKIGSSCILKFTLLGSQLPKNGIHGGPIVCLRNLDYSPILSKCYGPSQSFNITRSTAKSAIIKTKPSSTTFAATTTSSPITITNYSTSTTLKGLKISPSANLKLINNHCGTTLLPKRTCQFSLSSSVPRAINNVQISGNNATTVSLPVKVSAVPLATISSNPDALILTTSTPGNAGTVSVMNSPQSPLYANNITADLTGLSNILSANYNNCNSVAPGDTCIITFTANNTLGLTSIPIHGSNTNSIAVDVSADDASINFNPNPSPILLTISPPGNTTIIHVINNPASTVNANNLVADVSGTGGILDVSYNNCDSVAPGDSCAITFTANNVLGQTSIPISGSNTNPLSVDIAADQANISATPSSFSFLTGGQMQIVTITNNGPVDAYNVGVITPPTLGVGLVGGCPSLLPFTPPNNTCDLTFTSGNNQGTTSADIAGDNTNTITENISVNNSPVITSFTATPSAQPGQLITLSWTSTDSTSCIGSGGSGSDSWNNSSQSSQGSVNVRVPLTTGTVSYTLTCSGPGGDSNPLTVQVPVSVSECGVNVASTPISSSVDSSVTGTGSTVINRDNLIDADLSNFAQLSIPFAGATRSSSIQVYNSSLYPANRTVSVLISISPTQLAQGLLNNITINAYSGSTLVFSSNVASLNPQQGIGTFTDVNEFYVTLSPPNFFDSVQIQMNGMVGISGLKANIYGVCVSNN